MYVDEVGNGSFRKLDHRQNKYLSLTGLIIDEAVARKELHPRLETLKAECFEGHPDDETVVLHRKDITQFSGPFACLRDPATRTHFESELLDIYRSLDYCVVTVLLDKQHHREAHGSWATEPYQYCLEVLLERFVRELLDVGETGDVLVECTGRAGDEKLKRAYTNWWLYGTGQGAAMNIAPSALQKVLRTKELKLKPKSANVAGLQAVDLIAMPSQRHLLNQSQNGLSDQLARLLEQSKYRRSSSGRIAGYGTKML